MCGIGGIYSPEGRPIQQDVLKRMGDSIAHRGPDGEGFFLEAGLPSVGFVNRRLAVIDVDGGRQPMTVEDGAYTVVYNGELYNTEPLRRELEAHGHRFRTRCDTEVVVRGYAQWGPSVVDHLDGMWAFAIWDRPTRALFLARDRLGIKPLVYAIVDGDLVFGSEIKAIFASGLLDPEFNPTPLPHYLSAFAVPDPYTLFRGVRRLEAGHAMVVSRSGIREYEYWDCAVPEEPDKGRAHYREEIAFLLEDSVRRTMVSDVPLGVLLSGGVDSRLLATFANRRNSKLQTFTLGFDDPAYDERPAARAIAAKLGTNHHEAEMGLGDAASALGSLLDVYDEPGQSLIQTNFISRFAREHVTVALSGVGGDELFAAYPTHVAANLLARLDAVPAPLKGLGVKAGAHAPIRRLRRLSALSGLPPDQRITHELFHQTSAHQRRDLLSSELAAEVDLEDPTRYLVERLARARATHPLNRLLYLYLKTYLPNELLRSADAMSMWNSLELRVPFLDHRLVERAMAIPVQHKMRWTKGKLLLRDIAASTLDDPTSAVKRGFSPPLSTWLRGDLGLEIADTLTYTTIRARGIFDANVTTETVRRALAGDSRLVPAVMMLFSFEVWAQHWFGYRHLAGAGSRLAPIEISGSDRPRPELSVVIVSWNTRDLTRAALQSLQTHLGSLPHEVIVVDNNSSDGSQAMILEEFPQVRLMANDENLGFGRANNQGMAVARGRYFLLLNSDAALIDDGVVRLVDRLRRQPTVGVAHCKLLSVDGTMQHTTYRFPTVRLAILDNLAVSRLLGARRRENLLGGYWNQSSERDVDAVAGAFMLLRREVYEQTGGFNERIFMYGEDIEWCARINDRAWKVRLYPEVSVLHHDHSSSEKLLGDSCRITLSLAGQVSLVRKRQGAVSSVAFMLVLLVATTLRLAYYSLRQMGPGGSGERFRAMIPFQRAVLRSLLLILMRRV
ncbi:MAG: asparagine synthase (glutamine-hydrolyzing) [Actinomycetota bacterium]|nr:asparagine synthase (glutamine-hydrolyzing) [Actinomycetota bacterium]